MTRFSRSDITRVLRSGPARTRSMASSRADIVMSSPPRRAVSSAASFMRLARSAPVKPGVRRASTSRRALAADRVDLVHEDDGGGGLLGLVEQVADPAGPDADEHLDEVGPGDREEGRP